jgi:hypothetical protein
LGEASEAYRLTIMPADGAARTATSFVPLFDYRPAAQAEDESIGASSFSLTVAQLGSLAATLPVATRTFTI